VSQTSKPVDNELVRLVDLSFVAFCIVGFDGYLKFANPAFARILGYTQEELLARPFVDTVHPDDVASVGTVLAALAAGKDIAGFECRQVCADGSMRWLEWNTRTVAEEDVVYGVARDVTDRRAASAELNALRRVATLVAEGVQPQDLFAVVAEEVSRVVDVGAVSVVRYELDGTATECANFNRGGRLFPVGVRWSIEGTNILRLVRDSGEAARIDDYAGLEGEMAEIVRRSGIRSTVGVPIVVAGRVWGTMVGSTTEPNPLPEDTKSRLADFTELLATAIENAESREALERLADEQATLRRVATLVAEGVQPANVFSALSEEVKRLLGAETCVIVRLETDGSVTVVADGGIATSALALGTSLTPEPGWVLTAALETSRPARKDDYGAASGRMPGVIRGLGIQSAVGVPIVVEGALWGVIVIGTVRQVFPDDTERRLEAFTALAATAVANADSRSQLAASRRRIVAASDEARARIERDLHDGTQQRLVSLSLALRAAEAAVPPDRGPLRSELSAIAVGLAEALEDLQELSRGIHPAILSQGGLGPALRTLARRSTISVGLDLDVGTDSRLPEPVEVAAYFVASEALANATKHAHASRIEVSLASRDGSLLLSIRDDGVGGADAARGSGLVGLTDRVEAIGGTIDIESAPGRGTSIVATLPLGVESMQGARPALE
jgi:PAS domain S-box-containing protein